MKYPLTKIEIFRPSIGEEEIDAVADVMRSGWIGRGPKVDQFESEWAAHIGVERENVVSVGCATEGLYQVMQWLSYGRNDRGGEVIIPDNSFIGTSSAVLESGLTVQLCDINSRTLNPLATDYKMTSGTLGIVYQHYGGMSWGFDVVGRLCQVEDVALVEDFACHPLGKPVGDYAVYSFDAMKVLTCGDGGMVYCKDTQAAESIRKATRLGMNTESGKSTGGDRWWEFKATTPGRRSMMNDIGAAIGLVQLSKLPQMVARRRGIWEYYQKQLDAPVHYWYELPPEPSESAPASYYTYWVACEGDGVRDRLAQYLRSNGIYCTYRYHSISKAYNWDNVNVPNSHWADSHILNLPLHPGLTDDQVTFICDTVAEFGRTL